MSVASLWSAAREVMSHRVIQISTAVQTLVFAALFSTLSTTQPIFDQTFGQGDNFPMWFAVIALCSISGSFANSQMVRRLGMFTVIRATYAAQLVMTLVVLGLISLVPLPLSFEFGLHILWSIGIFAMMGLTMGNLNAMAMEPMGHVAGIAAAIIGSTSSIMSMVIGTIIGQMYNGTLFPVTGGFLIFSCISMLIFSYAQRYQQKNAAAALPAQASESL